MQRLFIIYSKGLITTNHMAIKPDKTKSNKHQKALIVNCNIYTMYNKIKALSKHTGSKKLMIRETKSIMIIMLKLNGAI